MLPAQAGMILIKYCRMGDQISAPRAGGDDPPEDLILITTPECSPRRRG